MTYDEWMAEGERRFGPDKDNWRFVCPSCSHVATPAEWKAAGASPGEIAFSCIGRHTNGHEAFGSSLHGAGPCSYAGGGLFKLNPTYVEGEYYFAFAEAA